MTFFFSIVLKGEGGNLLTDRLTYISKAFPRCETNLNTYIYKIYRKLEPTLQESVYSMIYNICNPILELISNTSSREVWFKVQSKYRCETYRRLTEIKLGYCA